MENLQLHQNSTGLVLPDSWSDINTESRAAPGKKEKWRKGSLPLIHLKTLLQLKTLLSGSFLQEGLILFKPPIDQHLISDIYLLKEAQRTSKGKVVSAEYTQYVIPPR